MDALSEVLIVCIPNALGYSGAQVDEKNDAGGGQFYRGDATFQNLSL